MSVDLSRLKAYAPQARKDFRKAVTERAARIGIAAGGIVEAQRQGDVVIVGGTAYDKAFGKQRDALISKVKIEGFDQAIEGIAYTWFNRLVALRFMELHDYLDHGFQIVGPGKNGGTLPEALVNAELLNLPRLPADRVREMKIAGDYEEKLYRAILIAQCNALNEPMPFMFEKIGDATELLLPDNLLATDGLVRKLVQNSDAKSWQDVEVIGWVYQLYISEKKNDVFKALKNNVKISAANIPAATQLFTPHWIVRYLVENSLGRLWLLNNPSSALAEKMDYYIAPEEPEVDFLKIGSPEEIKICDPACGSGHMLTYAFDLLYTIYEEAGYRARDIPSHILQSNLQGIEIDNRAGALAAFSLAMKARAQDSRFFTRSVEPQICILEDVVFTEAELRDVSAVVGHDLFTDELSETLGQFKQATNFGSLIVPKLRDPAETLRVVEARDFGSDLLLKEVQGRVLSVLRMAEALSPKYHIVVANPPYMGFKNMNAELSQFGKKNFQHSKYDLFSMFMERSVHLLVKCGLLSMINMQAWMFLSSYEKLRGNLSKYTTLLAMAHLGERGFDTIGGSVVSTTAFVMMNCKLRDFIGSFLRLVEGQSEAEKAQMALEAIRERREPLYYRASHSDFICIPGVPISYWLGKRSLGMFSSHDNLGKFVEAKVGLLTSDNNRFLRYFWEVDVAKSHFTASTSDEATKSRRKWFPHNKGGGFRKWAGNYDLMVNWEENGKEIKETVVKKYPYLNGDPNFVVHDDGYYFRPCVSWSEIGSSRLAFRYYRSGFTFNVKGMCAFSKDGVTDEQIIALCNNSFVKEVSAALNPTLSFGANNLKSLPAALIRNENYERAAKTLISLAKCDWDAYETSWNFTTLPLLSRDRRTATLEATYSLLRAHWQGMTREMQVLEEENNRIFIDAYDLQEELDKKVPIEEITLTCNPAYRYGAQGTEEEWSEHQQRDTMRELISYAIGCMMGRYSLAEPGLIYANAGNIGFDASRYGYFHADDDGIVPVTDVEWFPDDATARFIDFLRQTFGEERLGENLAFVADSLEPKRKTSASDTIRKYISRVFFRDHLRTYKNRPIYWLFSSGKERAFECLVYLHRYNESTLGRMRAEYVIPLQTKMQNRIQTIGGEIARGDLSSVQMKARTKEIAGLEAKKSELDRFEANLRHMAEERIALDLDGGVKVNYGIFGDLLAETKLVCGTKDDD